MRPVFARAELVLVDIGAALGGGIGRGAIDSGGIGSSGSGSSGSGSGIGGIGSGAAALAVVNGPPTASG